MVEGKQPEQEKQGLYKTYTPVYCDVCKREHKGFKHQLPPQKREGEL